MSGIVPVLDFDEELAVRVEKLDEECGRVRRLDVVEDAERVHHVRDGGVVSAVHREPRARALHARVLRVPHDVPEVLDDAVAREVRDAAAGARVDRALEVEHHVAQELAGAHADHLVGPGLQVPLDHVDLVQRGEHSLVVELGNSIVHPRGLCEAVRPLRVQFKP